ncbi:MAG: hypothetical protein DRH12_04585 [Deltaproteobacteria bacterium]|nr:MAG: hypothetical protein DRH12_04585 [Deltaproteobacteria bacterium]
MMRKIIFFLLAIHFLFIPVLGAQTYNDFFQLVYNKDIDALKAFIQKCPDPNLANEAGSTMLMLVCNYPDLKECFELLLEKGADVNKTNKWGQTAIFAAAMRSAYYTKRLIDKGARVDMVDDSQGQTPFFMAVVNQLMNERPSFETLDVLLEHGANINFQITKGPNTGATPLMFAIMANNTEMVEYLLKHGADPYIRDSTGNSAIDYAKKENNMELIELLKHAKD